MITVQNASEIIYNRLFKPQVESVSLTKSLNHVLANDIIADRDFPPFDRVAMDGICIRYKDFEHGQREFNIIGTQAAGAPPLTHKAGCAIEIMTGAMLAIGADTVIRYEDLHFEDGIARVTIDDVREKQNVHRKGSDRSVGSVLLKKNTLISPTEIGVLATVGKSEVQVYCKPKVAIISTGDELVEVHETPLPYQIRKSNVYTLKAILTTYGIEPELVHLSDDKARITSSIETLLNNNDVLLMSGAVSKGKFDYLPEVLDSLGVEKHFHKVEQRPGKPFWFGTKKQTAVFAFPGNPVSTFVCAKRFFEPWLKKSYQQQPAQQFAALSEDVHFRPSLTYFLQVNVVNEHGKLIAHPVKGNGSGDLANLTLVNAFMELPPDKKDFKSGEVYPVWMFQH